MSITSWYRQLFGKGDPTDASVVEIAEHGRAGGVSTAQGFKYVRDADEKTIIDEANANTTYIGKAKMGASTSSSDWQIKKLSISGNVTSFLFADGDDDYDNVWDDRASLSYS